MSDEPREYEVAEEEGLRVMRLSPEDRVRHLIEKSREHNALWTLADGDSFAILATESEDGEFLPVWPHPDYAFSWAESCLNAETETDLESIELVAMPLAMFVNEAAQALTEADVNVLVFPTDESEGVLMKADDFAKRLDVRT